MFHYFSTVIAENNGSFPIDFLLGVGTSAYQIEGAWNVDGKGENIWDHWIHDDVTHIADNETADVACNSYRNYLADIATAKELNVSHYQFSISWSRLEFYLYMIDVYFVTCSSINLLPFLILISRLWSIQPSLACGTRHSRTTNTPVLPTICNSMDRQLVIRRFSCECASSQNVFTP